jgi:hypothetical protein
MRILLCLCLTLFWSIPGFALELRLLSDSSESWRIIEPAQEPSSSQELLALRAISAKATTSQDRMTAYYLGKNNGFDMVTVDEAPEDETESIHTVISYKLRDGMIVFETRPRYVAKLNYESEQIAREIALDYLLGRNTRIPVFINDRVYKVEYNGKCSISVIEMIGTNVQFTYRYTSCK